MAFCAFSHPPLLLVQDSRTCWRSTGCEHSAVPVRTETCPCHTGHEGSGTKSPKPPTPWHLLGGSSKPPNPTRVFAGVCRGKRSCRRRCSRVSEERAFGNLAKFQPHAGEEEFVHRSPSGLPCVLVQNAVRASLGVCSHPEPLKTGAPGNRSSEASASVCVCVCTEWRANARAMCTRTGIWVQGVRAHVYASVSAWGVQALVQRPNKCMSVHRGCKRLCNVHV